ncbi:MAG: hypothetical protein U1F09_15990 [Steroidobacteraceae bacterium]
MKSRHHLRWVLAALAFGVLVLPALVCATGERVLGPYAGGIAAFYGNFVADLAALRPAAWTLALGPAALAALWRGIVAWGWREA